MKACGVVKCGVVVGGARGAATRIPHPGSNARDHTTNNWPDAGHVLVALPVPKLGATGFAVAALPVSAFAGTKDTARVAESVRAGASIGAFGVAVDVVARLWRSVDVAKARAIGFPPSGCDASGWARVLAVDRATEFRIAVAAK